MLGGRQSYSYHRKHGAHREKPEKAEAEGLGLLVSPLRLHISLLKGT